MEGHPGLLAPPGECPIRALVPPSPLPRRTRAGRSRFKTLGLPTQALYSFRDFEPPGPIGLFYGKIAARGNVASQDDTLPA